MFTRTLFAAAVLAASLASPAIAQTSTAAKDRTERQLNAEKRGKAVLQFLHAGSDYRSHKFNRSGGVTGKPGHFYLEYEFNWKAGGDNGSTTLSFFFGADGQFNGVKIDKTDAILNQPFALANLSIAVIGQTVLEALKDNLTDNQRRLAQKMIDNADAKGLLELYLLLDLAGGR